MAPSSALQSRISTFEALGPAPLKGPPKIPAKVPSRSSAANLLEAPISPTAKSISPIAPQKSPIPARKASLIDLRDWVVDDGPARPSQSPPNGTNGAAHTSSSNFHVPQPTLPARRNTAAPLINLESPPSSKVQAPPLPPRKPSNSSLRPTPPSTSSPPALPKRSDSLTVEGHHTYPPISNINTGDDLRKGHVPASSVSSFQSISLSSDGGMSDIGTPTSANSVSNFVATYPMDRREETAEDDKDSLDGSYEDVSTIDGLSPIVSITHDWEKRPEPPKLPQRPTPTRSVSPTPSPPQQSSAMPKSPRLAAANSSSRRPPPPPPMRGRPTPPSSRSSVGSASNSDRSSVLSNATTSSRTSISTFASIQSKPTTRPIPVPVGARRRYENVFVANVRERRRVQKAAALLSPQSTGKRSRAGWRGLSVDLITNPEDNPVTKPAAKETGTEDDQDVGPEEKLDANTVKLVWSKSKLDKTKLRDLWNECDPERQGCLNREAFVKGMWRIDEELRRAHLLRQSSSNAHRSRQPKRVNSRPVLH